MSEKPGGGRRERYVQPSILMALLEGATYGYELIRKLSDYGFIRGEAPPGMIYRHLRQMEEEGMVASSWEVGGGGPAKRLYTLTNEGREVLDAWIDFMERQADTLRDFAKRYRRRMSVD